VHCISYKGQLHWDLHNRKGFLSQTPITVKLPRKIWVWNVSLLLWLFTVLPSPVCCMFIITFINVQCQNRNWSRKGCGRIRKISEFLIQQYAIPSYLISTVHYLLHKQMLGSIFHGKTVTVVNSSWNVVANGDAQEGKWRGNWQMEWVASTLHTTSEHGVSSVTTPDVHTSAASSRLNW